MIFLVFIAIAVLMAWDFEQKKIRFAALPYLLVIIYSLSLTPTLSIPYLVDDLDILYGMRAAQTPAQTVDWLLTPHNEHVIPIIKAIMWLFFNVWNIYMLPIHLLIIISCALILIIFYKLLLKLTNSPYTALLGMGLLASTNLADFATYMFIEANLFFCLCLFLLLFYSQLKFFHTKQKRWLILAFISAVMNPWTFNLGLTSIAFAVLFEYLCLSSGSWRMRIPILLTVACGWGLSLLPYIYSFQKVLHAQHYAILKKNSALEVAQVLQAIPVLFTYTIDDLIPNFLPHLYLSMGIFFCALMALAFYRRQIDYKKIVFFLLFGMGLTFIIYVFRLGWGLPALDRARYDILPTAMLAAIYALIFHPLIEDKISAVLNNRRITILGTMGLILIVSFGGNVRYNRADQAAQETTATVQKINIVLRQAFLDYLQEVNPAGTLKVKNSYIFAPRVPSFDTRKYHIPIALLRYSGRQVSFFATLLLPPEVYKRISWGETTDAQFLTYLKDHRNQYGMLLPFLE